MSAAPGAGTATGVRGPVAVSGGGLIGTSIALALSTAGLEVHIHDQDPLVRARLRELLTADGPRVTDTWQGSAEGAGTVVAAVPPPAVAGVLREGARHATGEALLTDVAGVKGSVVRDVLEALADEGDAGGRFVGGHPMAGSERSGPDAADGTLFSGATWVLTPSPVSTDTALGSANALVRTLGGRVLVLDPDEHDAIVGLVSHLPQLVASVLADVAAEAVGTERDAVMAVAGPGFRDTTRIAASDPALWLNLVASNRRAVSAALGAFGARFADVMAAVEGSDGAALETILARASAARRRLLPKGLDAPTRDLIIPLRDRPGEIARIAGALGSVGVNIEDLTMRHATAADRGSLLVRVRADDVQRAVEALERSDVPALVTGEGPAMGTDAAAPATAPGDGA